ncbi:hypothetical protein F5Y15DRAFT_407356 [Xylariaceae sp. FL0016]|nr:hypothetical protein F5Y15DRAFT_407356 [Xylariaceae sp. FL0016]
MNESADRDTPVRPKPRKRPRPLTQPKKRKHKSRIVSDFYKVRDILAEDLRNGKQFYHIDWEPNAAGEPYPPTWEPEENVNQEALNHWRRKKRAREGALEIVNAPSTHTGAPDESSTQETDPIQVPRWKRSAGERKSDTEILQSSSLPSQLSQKRRRTDDYAGSYREHQIVVELPRIPTFDPTEYQAISSNHSSQQSSQTSSGNGNQLVRQQRIIPDSLETTGTSTSESQDSRPETAVSAGVQSLSHPEHHSSSEIPSHQYDPDISEDAGCRVSHTSSGGYVTVFLTQQALDWDPPAATPLPQSLSDFNKSVVSASQKRSSQDGDSRQTTSCQPPSAAHSSSQGDLQAAQIVVPLTSQLSGSSLSHQSDFSVFEEHSPVPETVRKRRQQDIPQESQESSQALSESNGNIGHTSFEREDPVDLPPHVSASQSQSPTIPSRRSGSADLHANTSFDLHPRNSLFGSIDENPPLSAREKLRRLREANFNKPLFDEEPRESVAASESYETSSAVPNEDTQSKLLADPAVSAEVAAPMTPPLVVSLDVIEASQERPDQAEPTQLSAEPIQSREILVEDSSLPQPYEERPEIVDPSKLTLSIERELPVLPDDVVVPGLPILEEFIPEYEFGPSQEYPRSLIPFVPTAVNEYLITLPLSTRTRPQYNDILRDNETVIHDHNACFRVSTHETPSAVTSAELDQIFTRLFDICDFPPFLDTVSSLSSEKLTKHLTDTSPKFSWVVEYLDTLAELHSNKKILILSRPGKLVDLLTHVVQTRGYDVVGSGSPQQINVVVSSTSGEISSTTDIDAVIAFDHTFDQNILPPMQHNRKPMILALVCTATIQHLNMRIMENLEPAERKNMLMLALVKAMRYIEDPENSPDLYESARKFAGWLQDPDNDDFYHEPESLPDEIFEDMYTASSQMSCPGGQGLGDQLPGSRKRSYDDQNDDTVALSKRPKLSQPQVISGTYHISDALRELIDSDASQLTKESGESGKAAITVPIARLEALSAKIAELEVQLKKSREVGKQFKELSDRSQEEVRSHVASTNKMQLKYMEVLKDRGVFEAQCKSAKDEANVLTQSLASSRAENVSLKEKQAELHKQLSEANESLLASANPQLMKVARLQKDADEATAKVQHLERRLAVTASDMEYAQNNYRDVSQRATELASENRAYEKQIEELRRKADQNIIEVHKLQNRNTITEIVRQLNEQKSIVRDREAELNRVKDELKSIKNGRRETRQSSVPRSPRLGALGVNSPRNGTRGPSAIGGGSRGNSPAPPMGVFESPSTSVTPNPPLFHTSGNNRFAHLRDTRF